MIITIGTSLKMYQLTRHRRIIPLLRSLILIVPLLLAGIPSVLLPLLLHTRRLSVPAHIVTHLRIVALYRHGHSGITLSQWGLSHGHRIDVHLTWSGLRLTWLSPFTTTLSDRTGRALVHG